MVDLDGEAKDGGEEEEKKLAEEAPVEQSAAGPSYQFSVKENLDGALIANLSGLEFDRDSNPVGFKEFFILNDDDAKEKFSITDSGLLFTKACCSRAS